MALTREEVLHVAKLAKLTLTEKEVVTFSTQLSPVVDYFTELKEVNTQSVDPTSQTTGLFDVLRPDEIDPTRTLTQEQALSQAQNKNGSEFVVPLVLIKE